MMARTRSTGGRLARAGLLAVIAAAALVSCARAQRLQDWDGELSAGARVRRQQGAAPAANAAPGLSVQGTAQASAVASSSGPDLQAPTGGQRPANAPPLAPVAQRPPAAGNFAEAPAGSRRPRPPARARPTRPALKDADEDEDEAYNEADFVEPARRPARRRGPSTRGNRRRQDEAAAAAAAATAAWDRDGEGDDEYCEYGSYDADEDNDADDDADYGHLFKPMRHMARVMGGVFDQMQGMASSGFANMPRGPNMALASSSVSSSDGYSRTSSLVNNNGRTRGLVSETRNGRTQTRRIGDAGDDEE